ncbi:hypothetical protein [Fodinibius sp. Rm-B-1B1-1]|uniref:hypothetical protein n=1 Tax=Fodinibius alkaliphilus TaxID=3140241 RepID=UPI00315AAA47
MSEEEKYFTKLDKEDLEANRKAFKEHLRTPTVYPERTVEMMYDIPDKTHQVSIDEVTPSEDILKPTRQNPLFDKLHFQSVPKLERYIKQHKVTLERMIKYYSNWEPTAREESNLPAPGKIAERFYKRPKNTRKSYDPEEIKPVMIATRDYILNEGIKNMYGHVHTIYKKVEDLEGSKNAQKNWIRFYAEEAGLKHNEG